MDKTTQAEVSPGLGFLAMLSSSARAQVIGISEDVEFDRGDVVAERGRRIQSMWIVTEGVLEVSIDEPLTRIGPGGIVGEIGLILGRRSTATIRAVERTMALAVERESLLALASSDTGVGASIWAALAGVAASRVVTTTSSWERANRVAGSASPLPDDLEHALDAFSAAMDSLDRAGVAPTEAQADDAMALLTRLLHDAVGGDDPDRALLGRLQERLVPVLSRSTFAERCWSKPRGYAGDAETIDYLYLNEPSGLGPSGVAIDGALLRTPTARAVRNRRGLLTDLIHETSDPAGATIAALACGPAREVFDAFGSQPPASLSAHLLDIDAEALAEVDRRAADEGLSSELETHRCNLVKMALGIEQLSLPPIDLAYSIGLIDYFPDELVVSLLDVMHDWLAPGGRAVLGNFETNPVRGWFELVEWSLIYRTEADMERLFAESRFGGCEEIRWEAEGINLFAIGKKS